MAQKYLYKSLKFPIDPFIDPTLTLWVDWVDYTIKYRPNRPNEISRTDLIQQLNISSSSATRVLTKWVKSNKLIRHGKGPSTKYRHLQILVKRKKAAIRTVFKLSLLNKGDLFKCVYFFADQIFGIKSIYLYSALLK